jgi:hypothetical protein
LGDYSPSEPLRRGQNDVAMVGEQVELDGCFDPFTIGE